MSFLLTLEEERLVEIIEILSNYEQKVQDAAPIFDLDGRRLEEIAKNLPKHQMTYDRYFQEVKSLEDWLLNLKEKKNAKYWKKYLEGYPKQLTTRDIQAYMGGEKEIVELNQILIEVTLIKKQLESIVDSIRQMGWMVANITKLRVAELGDIII